MRGRAGDLRAPRSRPCTVRSDITVRAKILGWAVEAPDIEPAVADAMTDPDAVAEVRSSVSLCTFSTAVND